MSVLKKVRNWIDGDSAESVLEDAARDAQVKPRSNAEEFIVKLARGVEDVMQREMVPLPQGTTIIPTEYIIFLSDDDDKEWQGVKRRGLEQGLYHVLGERAKEISGKKKLETQSFAVELRVDGTLEKGDIRVQHSWDDDSSGKTGILARPKPQQTPPPKTAHPVVPFQTPPTQSSQSVHPTQFQQLPTTNPQFNTPAYSNQQADNEEATRVQKRTTPELYRLEIWHSGVRQNVVPIHKNEIVIGRGSKSKPVDIPLSGDPEISRRHVVLIFNGNSFWIVSEGKNALTVANKEIAMGKDTGLAWRIDYGLQLFTQNTAKINTGNVSFGESRNHNTHLRQIG